MRVLFLSQYFPPEPGAPAARVSELTREWVRLGAQVDVLAALPHHPAGVVPPAYRGKLCVDEGLDGVSVRRTWIYATPNKGLVRRSLAYASYSLSASFLGQLGLPEPDVVVATSPQLLCGAAGALVATLRRKPFVLEVRDLWPDSVVAVGALPERHPLIRGLTVLEEFIYRRAQGIVVVTDSFRERLLARGFGDRPIEVIKNGADLSRFVPAPRDTALRQRLGLQESFVAVYAGTHGMAHGLDAVLDCAKHLAQRAPRVHLLFVGDGAERERLQRRASAEGIGNVTFLGPLPRESMREVYATSDVCLVPLRRSELFQTVLPSKIFEIAAMERPLILSVDGEARALVESADCGLYTPPEDAQAMAEAILRLAAAPELAQGMARRGRAHVVSHHDRRETAARYLSFLQSIARGQAPTSADTEAR